VVSRDNSRLERLRSFVPASRKDNLTTIVGDVGQYGSVTLYHSKTLFTASYDRDYPPPLL